jgi:probable F420-dependent oxidoreductase
MRGALAVEIGATGVWSFTEGMSAAEAADFARRVEALGYSALWIPEALGRHPFAHAAWLLAATSRLVLATGIASIYARDAHASAQALHTLNEQSDGRFVLGLGVSHAPLVEGVRGHRYESPVARMRTYLEALEKAPYTAVPPRHEGAVVIAALGPRMLRLAAEKTRGAHPYLVPPEHTARAREILGPGPWLCVEQKVLLERDASTARAAARRAIAFYLKLPNYRNNLKRLGFGDADLDDGGSDRLVDALVAWGDERALAARVRAHRDAGASHVCVQPLHPQGRPLPDLRALEALAGDL